MHTCSDKVFMGIVVNRALPYLHEGSLKMTLTVPVVPRSSCRLYTCTLYTVGVLSQEIGIYKKNKKKEI